MLIGYARVSTDDQNLSLQRAGLCAARCERIFEEKISGAHRERPQLAQMLDHLRSEDVVVVTRLDRLARSTRDLLEIADTVALKGAGLLSLAEPWADTTSASGKMILTVFAGIAEFERSLINERTGAGRAQARARGSSLAGQARSLKTSGATTVRNCAMAAWLFLKLRCFCIAIGRLSIAAWSAARARGRL